MARYIASRALQALGVVLGVIVLTFVIARLSPGDPAVAYAGPRATAEQLAAVREQFGLDLPLWQQFLTYLAGLAQGDLGIALHDPASGGCRDGLHHNRANENQGAESTLAFQIALTEMTAAEHSLTHPALAHA
jgi:hypothetical protein